MSLIYSEEFGLHFVEKHCSQSPICSEVSDLFSHVKKCFYSAQMYLNVYTAKNALMSLIYSEEFGLHFCGKTALRAQFVLKYLICFHM